MAKPVPYSAEWLRRQPAAVSVKTASRVLGRDPRTVIRLINAGELPGARLGRFYVVSRDGLLAVVDP